jgi:hypothetical protein
MTPESRAARSRSSIFRPLAQVLSMTLAALFLISSGSAAYVEKTDHEWDYFAPLKSEGKSRLKSGSRTYSYYTLDDNKPTDYVVRGPRYVKILSRHLPPKPKTGKQFYTLIVERDRRGEVTQILEQEIAASWSDNVRLEGGDLVGQPEEVYLFVPNGRHTLKLYVKNNECPVGVRMYKEKKIIKDVMISLTPETYERVCTLVQPSGNEYPHYRFTHETPLHFVVSGPTRLELCTRLDFADNGDDRASYAIRITGHNAEGRTLETGSFLKADKLSKAIYKDCPEIAPGDVQVFILDVPRGHWAFDLSLINSDHPGATTRILMPRSDLEQTTP